MISSLNFKILSGGFSHCNIFWNKSKDPLDQCFKLYFPQNGKINLLMENRPYEFIPNHAYFINGYQIQKQTCIEEMDIYWLHFVPESLYLKFLLMNLNSVYSWEPEEFIDLKKMYVEIPNYFEISQNKDIPNYSLNCLMHSMILLFVSKILQTLDTNTILDAKHILQIKPSIDMMNTHYKQNPSLSAIAEKSFLVDKYFHRLFTSLIKVTPFNYMLSLRMNHAIELLNSTSLNIKTIAENVGYENEAYFTRVFKNYFKVNPSIYRKNKHILS